MSDAAPSGALAGFKIIDLSRVLGGPYCTQILADHGAEVIKIEPPQGDEVRDWGPPFRHNDASYFIGVNRNKRSMGLDLSRPGGRETLLRLLEALGPAPERGRGAGAAFQDVRVNLGQQLGSCRVRHLPGRRDHGVRPRVEERARQSLKPFAARGLSEVGLARREGDQLSAQP